MSINRILYAAVLTMAVSSCADTYTESYNIQGSSSVSLLDGSKLYLKVMSEGDLKSIDSCEIVHGDFGFTGRYDSTLIGMLAIQDGGMPIVIEKGDIKVSIDKMANKVSGSPLNDILYDFLDKHIQLANQMGELGHKEARMMLDGIDEQTIAQRLSQENQLLMMKADSLETHFILDNLDNVLGPYVFQMLTANYRYPMLTPQIEEIMAKATDKFKNDPYVRSYYSSAKGILARMKGEDAAATSDAAEAKPETHQEQ